MEVAKGKGRIVPYNDMLTQAPLSHSFPRVWPLLDVATLVPVSAVKRRTAKSGYKRVLTQLGLKPIKLSKSQCEYKKKRAYVPLIAATGSDKCENEPASGFPDGCRSQCCLVRTNDHKEVRTKKGIRRVRHPFCKPAKDS